MRPPVAIVIGLLLALIAALLWVDWRKPAAAGGVSAPDAQAAAGPVAESVTNLAAASSEGTPATNDAAFSGMPVPVPDSAIQTVIADEQQIQGWLLSRGPEALPGLLGKLDCSSAEVRGNALEALKQLGDRQAISVIRQKAEFIQDPDEQARFLAAADFLAAPRYGE